VPVRCKMLGNMHCAVQESWQRHCYEKARFSVNLYPKSTACYPNFLVVVFAVCPP